MTDVFYWNLTEYGQKFRQQRRKRNRHCDSGDSSHLVRTGWDFSRLFAQFFRDRNFRGQFCDVNLCHNRHLLPFGRNFYLESEKVGIDTSDSISDCRYLGANSPSNYWSVSVGHIRKYSWNYRRHGNRDRNNDLCNFRTNNLQVNCLS